MKLSIITSAILCTLTATGLVSCGGSDTSSAGSSNSSSTVVGTVIGFGSIIMDNGVAYDTDAISDCEVDDLAVSGVCEDSLSTGMRVTLHTDASGVVTSLKYDDELEGVAGNVAGTSGDYTFEVYGVTVRTSNPDTQWDDFSNGTPLLAELDGVSVEVSGEWQPDGTLLASYVEQQGAGDSDHEVKGTVGAISGTDFPLTLRDGSTIIDVDGSALNLLFAEGDFVELKGSFDSVAGLFTATESEVEDEDDFDSDSEAEITGTLTADIGSITGFSIGNTDVDISSASSCIGLTGLQVEAEGRYDADTGVLLVRECEDEDEDMEVKCMVSNNAIIPDSTKPKVGSVDCAFTGTTGDPLTIKFNDSPDVAMFSGDSTTTTFDLTDVLAGDCVEIKFSQDANGDYIAGLIEDEGVGCGSYELESTLDNFNDGSDITVLGVTFAVDPATLYDPSKAALVDGAKVTVKDADADGTADVIEAE